MSRNKARAEVTLPASFAFFRRTVPATAGGNGLQDLGHALVVEIVTEAQPFVGIA